MKAKLIKRAALAAAILAGGGVAYGNALSNGVVYCTAVITEGGDYAANAVVSVSLPPTEGDYDDNGNPVTVWRMGNVPAGGVTDSWHGEGGPGRFTAKNTGNVSAYFYMTTSREYQPFVVPSTYSGVIAYSGRPYVMTDSNDVRERLGISGHNLSAPCVSPKQLRETPSQDSYHLAFTTDIMAKVPTWHSLDHRYDGTSWSTQGVAVPGGEVAGFMGRVDAGDYLTFDLKFWAHPMMPFNQNVFFTFCVEASSFPLWDHGRAVE